MKPQTKTTSQTKMLKSRRRKREWGEERGFGNDSFCDITMVGQSLGTSRENCNQKVRAYRVGLLCLCDSFIFTSRMRHLWRESVSYLARQGRPIVEKHLHTGELVHSFGLKAHVSLPAVGEGLHGDTVRDGRAVQRSHPCGEEGNKPVLKTCSKFKCQARRSFV